MFTVYRIDTTVTTPELTDFHSISLPMDAGVTYDDDLTKVKFLFYQDAAYRLVAYTVSTLDGVQTREISFSTNFGGQSAGSFTLADSDTIDISSLDAYCAQKYWHMTRQLVWLSFTKSMVMI